jgi:organic radical activating enzyme
MSAEEKYQQGLKSFCEGRPADALCFLEEAVKEEATSERWNDWGAVQFSLGNVVDAERGFRSALDCDPEDAQSAANLGALLAQAGRPEEAISLLRHAATRIDEQQRIAVKRLLEECRNKVASDALTRSGEASRGLVSELQCSRPQRLSGAPTPVNKDIDSARLTTRSFFFYIEVLGMGQCNLRCPSCPTGNFREVNNPMGAMKPELLEQIMAKAITECVVTGVGLFNWAEPLLHPHIGELVRIVQRHGVPCFLSSNLNDIRNLEVALEANPAELRVSVSGFTQEVYGLTHRGGCIETVKENMNQLARILKKTKATTRIEVLYHRYKGNLDDEILMKAYATKLGFTFSAAWALFMPLEKSLAYVENDPSLATLTTEDYATLDKLALPLREALAAVAPYRNSPCTLQQDQITLDFRGNTMLCCAIYDADKYAVGAFLKTRLADIQARKESHPMCTRCMKNGIYMYLTYGAAELQAVALKTVFRYYSKFLSEASAVGAGQTVVSTVFRTFLEA